MRTFVVLGAMRHPNRSPKTTPASAASQCARIVRAAGGPSRWTTTLRLSSNPRYKSKMPLSAIQSTSWTRSGHFWRKEVVIHERGSARLTRSVFTRALSAHEHSVAEPRHRLVLPGLCFALWIFWCRLWVALVWESVACRARALLSLSRV